MSFTVKLNSRLILSLYYMYKVTDVSHSILTIQTFNPRVYNGKPPTPSVLCACGYNG